MTKIGFNPKKKSQDLFFRGLANAIKIYTFAEMLSPDKHIEDFDLLFRTYYPAAVLFAQKFVEDSNAAKEVAQLVFCKIYEKKDKIVIETFFQSLSFSSH